MPMIPSLVRRLAASLLAAALAACGTTSPPPAAPGTLLEQDVNTTSERLLEDWRARRSTPMWWARLAPASLAVVDVVDLPATAVDSAFAPPQSKAAAQARRFLLRRLAAAPDLRAASPEAAALLLSADLAPPLMPDGRRRLTLRLLDAKSGETLARAQGELRSSSADAFPAAFDAESPVLFQRAAAGADTVEGLAAAAVIAEGRQAYADGDDAGALALFERAATMRGVDAVRVYSGLYMSRLKLGRKAEAMDAFRQLVAEGLSARALGIKLLFVPGRTEFLDDAELRSAYAGWLQVIARQAAARATCLDVVGHTSHTGAEAYNLELSLKRSQRVQQLLQAEAPPLGERLSGSGKGWAENIVGSGTDDARDAVDRRVEFRVVNCPG